MRSISSRAAILSALITGALLHWPTNPAAFAQPQVNVAVSAALVPMVTEAARAVEARTSATFSISGGSTGLLARQFEQGAPFDALVSSDDETLRRLCGGGYLTTASRRVLGDGKLAVFMIYGGCTQQPPLAFRELPSNSLIRDVAVAKPELAPYGRAALQALRRAGATEAWIKEHVVPVSDVGQAKLLAERQSVSAAFISAAQLSSIAQPRLPFTLWSMEVPSSYHDPLVHSAALRAPGDTVATQAALVLIDELTTGSAAARYAQRYQLRTP